MNLGSLAVRNIRRNSTRTFLTALGVAVAVVSFVLLRTTLSAWLTGVEHAAEDRLATMNKITFVMPLPRRYYDEFNGARGTVEGVKAATFQTWFGAKHPTRTAEFFANIAVETDTFFDVYSDMAVPADRLAAWKENRQGAIIGDALSKQFGWNVGDEITLTGTIFPGDWKFRIEGIYTATRRAVDRSQFLFHYDYLNQSIPETRRDVIGWISCTIDGASRGAEIANRIDHLFEEQEIQTKTLSEKALQQEFVGSASAILTALDVVSMVIMLIMMLILGNTIAMSVRERTHEYGVLLAIGFRPHHIAAFVAGEAVAIGLLGGAVGLLVAYPLVQQGLGRYLEENMGSFFPYFRIPPSVAVIAIALAVTLAALAAVIPAWRAARLNAVEALRRLG